MNNISQKLEIVYNDYYAYYLNKKRAALNGAKKTDIY